MSSHHQALARARASSAAILGLLVGFALLGSRAVAACEMPPLAAVPAAKDIAGKEKEILADVQRYHDAMTAYAECLKKELTEAGGNDAPPLLKTILVNRYNSAVAEVQAVLKTFDDNVKPTARNAAPNHKFENGGVDSAFQQFPGGGTTSSGLPRPPGN
jgi:hypothetical protein